MDKLTEMNLLFDFYGPVLTERQQRVFTMYHLEDLSLGEIAQQLDISRQGVYDLVHRSERTLRELEDKLGLVRRFHEDQGLLAMVQKQLETSLMLLGEQPGAVQVRRALDSLRKLQ